MNGGGLDVGGEEGGEGDVGEQSGAGIVDEGIDLLGFLTAGFNLETQECSDFHSALCESALQQNSL